MILLLFPLLWLAVLCFKRRPLAQVLPITFLKQIMCLIILIVWSQCTDRTPYASVDLTSLVMGVWIFRYSFYSLCPKEHSELLSALINGDLRVVSYWVYNCIGNFLNCDLSVSNNLYIEANVSNCIWRHWKLFLTPLPSYYNTP